jgi:hypothetical protein
MVYCETFKFPQEVDAGGGTLYAGVFNYRTKDYFSTDVNTWVYTTCRSYSYLDKELGFDYDIDSKTRTAMAFSIMAPVIGGITLVFAYVVPCLTIAESQWKCIGITFALAGLFQGIALLVQNSSVCLDNPVLQYLESNNPDARETFGDECEWGPGYKLSIAAVVFWFVAGLSTFVLPAPVVSRSEPVQTQTVTYQQTSNGSVEETNVVVVVKGAAVDTTPAEAAIEDPLEEPKKE